MSPPEALAIQPELKTAMAVHPDSAVPLGERWWNINMPVSQWTKECPDFLVGQAEKDVNIISTKDEDHPRMSWDGVKNLIDTNNIGQFHRMPSDLRRYIKYCSDLKKRYGSILHFIQHERLNWPTIEPTGDTPFTNETEYRILYNDWPYSLDTDIVHIVVWTKFELEDDPSTGRLKEEFKQFIEEFVVRTFCTTISNHKGVDRQKLRWFKNWKSLRSVHALEHFHIMLHKPPPELIQKVTQGDIPMCERFES